MSLSYLRTHAPFLSMFLLFNIICLSINNCQNNNVMLNNQETTREFNLEKNITPESALRLHSTFEKIVSFVFDLEKSIQNKVSDKFSEIKDVCQLTREVIKETYNKIRETDKISINTAQFIFAIKAFLMVVLFTYLSLGLFNVRNAFVLTKNLAKILVPYLAYLSGNITKNVLIGLKTTLKDCVNFKCCSPVLKEKLTRLQERVVKNFDVNFVIDKAPGALVTAMTAAMYDAFGKACGLFKVVFPAYIGA
ncbi:MAG: hypothetical protein ABH827_04000 [bacterium]